MKRSAGAACAQREESPHEWFHEGPAVGAGREKKSDPQRQDGQLPAVQTQDIEMCLNLLNPADVLLESRNHGLLR
jgi:hypothetical protein